MYSRVANHDTTWTTTTTAVAVCAIQDGIYLPSLRTKQTGRSPEKEPGLLIAVLLQRENEKKKKKTNNYNKQNPFSTTLMVSYQ